MSDLAEPFIGDTHGYGGSIEDPSIDYLAAQYGSVRDLQAEVVRLRAALEAFQPVMDHAHFEHHLWVTVLSPDQMKAIELAASIRAGDQP